MLSDKIWVTRKARIYAERRLQRKAIISQTLITFYSAFLVCLSIWTLLYPSSQLNTFLVFASITVLVASIVLYSHRYSERSLAMRNCYIRLDELYARAKRSEQTQDYESLIGIESEYASLLLNVENHTDYDYLCFRVSLPRQDNSETTLPALTKLEYARYLIGKLIRVLLILFYFTLPGLLGVAWNLLAKNGSFK
jgi:hypothetical protein